jgi:tetratricopeptide (TPR) repeat protein
MRQGQVEQGEYHQQKALAILQDIGDREFVAYLQMELGSSLLLYAGEFAEARALLEEAAQTADGLEQHVISVLSKLFLGAADLYAGEYRRARTRLDQVCALAREHCIPQGMGLSLWLLGCVALAEGARKDAVRFLQEGVGTYRESLQREELGWALAGLGLAEREAGLLLQAKQHLVEAMRIGVQTGASLAMLLPLPGIALLLADAGDWQQAVELYALAAGYPLVGNARWFEDVAGRHIAAIAASLPPEVAAAARERGRARRLAMTAEELLAELGA